MPVSEKIGQKEVEQPEIELRFEKETTHVLAEVTRRIKKAEAQHGLFNSTHEILGVLVEELDVELKTEIHQKRDGYFELLDIATVAIRAASQIRAGKLNGS